MEDVVSKLYRVLREVEERRQDPLNPISVNVGVVVHISEDETEEDVMAEICNEDGEFLSQEEIEAQAIQMVNQTGEDND